MRFHILIAVLVVAISSIFAHTFRQGTDQIGNGTARKQRMWSLFSSSKDSNNDETCSNNVNTGICVSSSKCKSKGGSTISGPTCSNSRVCCQITANCNSTSNGDPNDACIIKNSGTTIVQETGMNNYRRTYRYRKPKGVCQVRLDFDEFVLADPDETGDCSTDIMQVEGRSICGMNRGQHVYLDYGERSAIDVSIRIRNAVSRYNIRNTYIPCNSDRLAPPDCLQYYRTLEGTVTSFNFVPNRTTTLNRQTNNLDYSVCIKPANGMNRIQWRACRDIPNAFFISGDELMGMPLRSPNCNRDYVQIYGQERYCGKGFNLVTSIVKPFLMNVHFDEAEGFAVALPTDPNECNGLIIDEPYSGGFFQCGVELGVCTCELMIPTTTTTTGRPGVTNPLPFTPDFDNTGFCLEYVQIS